jgi:tetratricopeptide (TPR) repeat protein
MPEVRQGIAATFLAIAVGIAPASAAPPDPNARYKELVAAYAGGDRAAAVAGVGSLDDDALRNGVESLRDQSPRVLLAALMLHTDRRLLERPTPDAAERTPACESAHTEPAWRVAQYLMLHVGGTDFARRWSIALALQDRWDGCYQDAFRWIDAGARWFSTDPEVLLVRGTLYETFAALPSPLPRQFAVSTRRSQLAIFATNAERVNLLNEARRSLERALAADPALDLARLRLGRVLWRLGKGDDARRALEGVIERSRDDAVLHLAHLFVARVHQDARRDDIALREYRAAIALQPTSQPAAIGLADALQLAGQPEEARSVVEGTLAEAGRRPSPQSAWEYAYGNARQAPEFLDRLREDSAR